MAVENFDLGHGFDDFEAVVWFFGQWVPEQVELLEKGESRKELEEDVEVAQLVVTQEQYLQELEFANALDALQLVVLAVEFFDPEVALNVVQVS